MVIFLTTSHIRGEINHNFANAVAYPLCLSIETITNSIVEGMIIVQNGGRRSGDEARQGEKEVVAEMVAPSVPIAIFGGFERICQDPKKSEVSGS